MGTHIQSRWKFLWNVTKINNNESINFNSDDKPLNTFTSNLSKYPRERVITIFVFASPIWHYCLYEFYICNFYWFIIIINILRFRPLLTRSSRIVRNSTIFSHVFQDFFFLLGYNFSNIFDNLIRGILLTCAIQFDL